MMIEGQGDAGLVVHLTTDFRAPPDKIWKTWVEPELLSKWFMAAPGYLPALAEVDLNLLGAWKITVRPAGDIEQSVLHGHFFKVVPGRELSYSWQGNVNGGQYATLVNVKFEQMGDGSRLTLTPGVFDSEADRIDPERGWEVCLGCLHQLVESE